MLCAAVLARMVAFSPASFEPNPRRPLRAGPPRVLGCVDEVWAIAFLRDVMSENAEVSITDVPFGRVGAVGVVDIVYVRSDVKRCRPSYYQVL